MRWRTAAADKTPPYGRETVFWRRVICLSLRGRAALMPWSGTPVSPQRGTEPERALQIQQVQTAKMNAPFFLRYKTTLRPPGVFDTFVLFDLVLYGLRRRYVRRCVIFAVCGRFVRS